MLNSDPAGDLFFAIPQIGFSNGSLSVSLEVGVGVPGVLSASATVGYGGGGAYWSVQGSAAGLYAGYGSNGAFAGFGYQYAGFSGGLTYGNDGFAIGVGYGVGGKGLTGFGASVGASYNFSSGNFGYSAGVAYTHIFEKPSYERITTYQDESASSNPVQQRESHDCLLGACEYMGPLSYEEIKAKFGDAYIPGVGTDTGKGFSRLYGQGNVDGAYAEVNPVQASRTWSSGGDVLVAQNRNHAVVLKRIELYKATFKYRKIKVQTRHRYTYMNPATGTFVRTGYRRHYKSPTYYINK